MRVRGGFEVVFEMFYVITPKKIYATILKPRDRQHVVIDLYFLYCMQEESKCTIWMNTIQFKKVPPLPLLILLQKIR